MLDEVAIQLRYAALDPVLDERGRRRFAAAEARSAGWGGVSALSRITGMARSTIGRGLAELRGAATEVAPGRVRRAGGGRKKLTSGDATLLDDLRELVEPATRGDPQAPLLWTNKSQRHLAAASGSLGHRIGHNAVASLLRELGYSLQSNRKTREGSNHPDRDAQFGYINAQTSEALTAGQPAISVDTKKKELVGDFKNGGNAGWVSVGIDHDTASYKRRQRSLSHLDGKEPCSVPLVFASLTQQQESNRRLGNSTQTSLPTSLGQPRARIPCPHPYRSCTLVVMWDLSPPRAETRR